MMLHDVFMGETDDAPPFPPGYRFGGVAERLTVTRFHFNEHQCRSVAGDNVQFATAAPVTPRNNYVPASLELAAREILAGFPERNAPA